MKKSYVGFIDLPLLFYFFVSILYPGQFHAAEESLCSSALTAEIGESEQSEELFIRLLVAAREQLGNAWIGTLGWIIESEEPFNPFQGDEVGQVAYSRIAEELLKVIEWKQVQLRVSALILEERRVQAIVEKEKENAKKHPHLERMRTFELGRDFLELDRPASLGETIATHWPPAPHWVSIEGESYIPFQLREGRVRLIHVLSGETREVSHVEGGLSISFTSPLVPFVYEGRTYAIYGARKSPNHRRGARIGKRSYGVYIMDLESGEIVSSFEGVRTDHIPMQVSDTPDGRPRFFILSAYYGSEDQKYIEVTLGGEVRELVNSRFKALSFKISEVLQVLRGSDRDVLLVRQDELRIYHILSYPDLEMLNVLEYQGSDVRRAGERRFDKSVPTLFWSPSGDLKYLLGPRRSIEDSVNRAGYDGLELRSSFRYRRLGRLTVSSPPVTQWEGVPVAVQNLGENQEGEKNSSDELQVISLESGDVLSRVFLDNEVYSKTPIQWITIAGEPYLFFMSRVIVVENGDWRKTRTDTYLHLIHAFEPELRSRVRLVQFIPEEDSIFTVVPTSEGLVAVGFSKRKGQGRVLVRVSPSHSVLAE